MSDFVVKDSGKREQFATGAKRDVQEGKPRYDLIPVESLFRLAEVYRKGAEKYGEGNFERGISFKRCMASILRHTYQYIAGDREEDHAAAAAWGWFALMFYEEQIAKGKLAYELNDFPWAAPTPAMQQPTPGSELPPVERRVCSEGPIGSILKCFDPEEIRKLRGLPPKKLLLEGFATFVANAAIDKQDAEAYRKIVNSPKGSF